MKKFALFVVVSLFTLSSCVVATKPGNQVVVTPNKVIVHPRIIFIPDYDVYILDDDRYEIYKYKGRWYWFNNGMWYVADDFNGPWVIYRGAPPFRIPPGHLKKMYKERWKEEKKFKHHGRDWDD